MKIPRPFLVAMGVVALVGAVLATLAFLPGVQRWALLRAAAQAVLNTPPLAALRDA